LIVRKKMTAINREKIYNMLSPRILEKKARRNAVLQAESKKPAAPLPVVDNAAVQMEAVAKPNNVKVVPDEPLQISPNEGKPAVNGQAVKLDIHPVGKTPPLDPGIASLQHIQPVAKKKPGRPPKNKDAQPAK
jgi:hypothetical protein